MKTIAVTIGVGSMHKQMAEWAAEKVHQYLDLETRIIGDEHMCYAMPDVPHPKNIWTIKFNLFDIYPYADRIMYFDNDWRPVRAFNVNDYCPDHTKLYFVRDRVYRPEVRAAAKSYNINPDNYFNGGWFMSHRQHQPLFQKCKETYHQFKETWGDQCVMNQVLFNDVTLLPQEINTLDFNYLTANKVLGFHSNISRYIAAKKQEDYDWN
jgi:lipopolysaccharide biosynthesis glycosyltransferase